jgi:hypothetical protein
VGYCRMISVDTTIVGGATDPAAVGPRASVAQMEERPNALEQRP